MSDILSRESTKPAAKASNNSTNTGRVKTGISRSYIESVDDPLHLKPVTGIAKMLPVKLHNFTSQGTQLCENSRVIQDPDAPLVACKWCQEDDQFAPKAKDPKKQKKNRAKDYMAGLYWVLNKVNTVREITKDNGEVITYNVNPLTVMEFPRGTEDANIESMVNYDNEGELTNGDLWEARKYHKDLKKAVTILPVDKIGTKNAKKKFDSAGVSMDVPQDILDRFEAMSVEEVRGIIFNCYVSNPKMWDRVICNQDTGKPVLVKPEPLETERKAEDESTEGSFEQELDG